MESNFRRGGHPFRFPKTFSNIFNVSFVASSATGTFTYYLNGVADGTFTPVSNGVGSGNMGVLGSTWDGGGQWNGFMAQCSIHSTNLSASQILQNYNAQRQRFGV
jgi:hypothetical protein